MDAFEEIQSCDRPIQLFVWETCRNFYITSIKQIQQRFNFEDDLFLVIKMVFPKNARSMNPPTLVELFRRFPNLKRLCDPARAEIEWRCQAILSLEDIGLTSEGEIELLDAESYWLSIIKVTLSGKPRFPNLCAIISFLFSIPCSNVIAERAFSLLKLIKTDIRNQMGE